MGMCEVGAIRKTTLEVLQNMNDLTENVNSRGSSIRGHSNI